MLSFRLNKVHDAIAFGESILDIISESGISMTNEFMLNLYVNLAGSYQLIHNYEMANKAYDRLLNCSMSDEYQAFVLNDIASNYLQQNKVVEAKEAIFRASDIANSMNNETLNNLLKITVANIYRIGGEFQKCKDLVEDLNSNGFFKENNPFYDDRVNLILRENAMWSYHMLGDDNKAMEYGEVFNNQCNIEFVDPLTFATWLLNYSIVESSYIDGDRPEGFPDISEEDMSNWLNRFRSPLEKKKRVYEIYKEHVGESSEESLMTMASIASLLAQIGCFQECVDISSELIEICEQSNRTDLGCYQLGLHLICSGDIIADEFWEGPSLTMTTNIVSIADKLMSSLANTGTSYTQNVLWSTLFNSYIKHKEFNKASQCLTTHFENLKEFTTKNLFEINDINIINSYWESISYNILTGIESKELWENPNMRKLFYDKGLFYKGMKLELFNNLFDDYKKDLLFNVSWRDIKNVMQEDEAAIEIIKTLDYDANGTHNVPTYFALILTNKSEVPEIRYICKEEDILSFQPSNYYNSSKFTKCLFGTVLEYLETNNISKVYFSPMGEYCNIAIESLKSDNGERLSDKYELYRLSSTRNLLLNKDVPIFHLLAFGDIDFDSSSSMINQKSYEPGIEYSKEYNQLRGCLRGLHFGKLNGTKIELDSITDLCNNKNIPFEEFRRNEASEFAFRNLKGKDVSVCHIATHGFLWNESNEYKNRLTQSILSDTPYFMEDLSMLNSGLLFAGANKTLKQDSIGDINNDGIITAYEISQLSLSDIDLLVLSACETGLGDIKGDGVFGLQRGFKQAGVNSIIMSLWEVDDVATQLLMTEFYKNYFSGLSKQKSLYEAQRVVRETPGFENPEYWAAFILLDGLN